MIGTREPPQEPRRPVGGALLLLVVAILGGVAAVPCARADDRAGLPAPAGDLAEENMRRMNIDWVSFEERRFAYRSPKPGEHYRLIVAATREKVKQNVSQGVRATFHRDMAQIASKR